jgi:ketosteroid isomerase-like protein
MATGTKNTTEAVLKHHVQALTSRNLDGLMEDYTRDSVLFSPNGASKGLQSIRAGFTAVLGMMTPEAMANMKVIKQDIDGEYAYMLWSAVPVVPFGGDTFYVHNGKIVMQSFVGQMGS